MWTAKKMIYKTPPEDLLPTTEFNYKWQFGCDDPVHPWINNTSDPNGSYIEYIDEEGLTIKRILPCAGDCITINANLIINDEQPGIIPC